MKITSFFVQNFIQLKIKTRKKIKNKKGERSHFSSKKHFGKSKPNCRLTLFSIWFLLMALNLRSARGWTRCSRDVRGWVQHSVSGGLQGPLTFNNIRGRDSKGSVQAEIPTAMLQQAPWLPKSCRCPRCAGWSRLPSASRSQLQFSFLCHLCIWFAEGGGKGPNTIYFLNEPI